jgi:dihydrofolate synthase/folylpolyglutamate synthase
VPITDSPNGRPPGELAEAAQSAGLSAEPVDTVEAALGLIADGWRLEPAPRILICGSLYLAGEVLKANGMQPE